MSFDLKDERVAAYKPLPSRSAMPRWLTEVCGRLAVAAVSVHTEVWLLDGGGGDDGGEWRWNRRDSL
uniref:Uncharacterized protein n=1 Tax=Oryza punctata TaxID=4537 RepID=A0A0E0LWB7_ORYPU